MSPSELYCRLQYVDHLKNNHSDNNRVDRDVLRTTTLMNEILITVDDEMMNAIPMKRVTHSSISSLL